MRLWIYIGLVSFFSLSSCIDQKSLDLVEVEKMAVTIETNMNANKAYELNQMFSPTRFAMRLGDDFYDLPKMDRQYGYAAFRDFYETIIYSYLDVIDEEGLVLSLFDIHEKDGVYRINFLLGDSSDQERINFLVFYAAFDKDDELKVVNLYNVFQGFSLSQIGEGILDDMSNNTTSFAMRRQRAEESINRAIEIAETGDFAFAYETLNRAPKSFLEKPYAASLKVQLSESISDSLYRKELQWMKSISPNDQSQMLYDCAILKIDQQSEQDLVECTDALVALLKES
jgi:hypothetical protein